MTDAPPLVLIVDDDPDMLAVEEDALLAHGYRVEKAGNGEEALKRVAEAMPALILLDMRMPVMDGWKCARAIRERYGRRIPIVVVTAAEDSKLRADEIGAEGELGKPFELDALYAVVGDVLGGP